MNLVEADRDDINPLETRRTIAATRAKEARFAQDAILLQKSSEMWAAKVELFSLYEQHAANPACRQLLRGLRLIAQSAMNQSKRSAYFPAKWNERELERLAVPYADVFQTAVNHFSSLGPKERSETRLLLQTLLDSSGGLNTSSDVKRSVSLRQLEAIEQQKAECLIMWQKLTKTRYPVIFSALHIFEVDGLLSSIRSGYVPRPVEKAYRRWKEEQRLWIDGKLWLVTAPVSSAPALPVIAPVTKQKSVIVSVPAPTPTPTPAFKPAPIPINDRRKTIWVFEDKPVVTSVNRLRGRYAPVVRPQPHRQPDPLDEMDWDELERQTAPEIVAAEVDVNVTEPQLSPAQEEIFTENAADFIASAGTSGAKGWIGVLQPGLVIDSGRDDHHEDEVHHGHALAFAAAAQNLLHAPYQKGALLYDQLIADKRVRDVRYHLGPGSSAELYPFSVIDVYFHEGADARIVLRNFTRFSTYIDRNPQPYIKGDPLDVKVLCDRMDVWRVKYKDDASFWDKVGHYLFTPVDALPHQVKRDLSWPGHYMDLLISLRDYVLEHHCLPSSKDTTPIRHGPLTNRTSWCGAAEMLKRERLDELADIKSFEGLYKRAQEHFPALLSVAVHRRSQGHKTILSP